MKNREIINFTTIYQKADEYTVSIGDFIKDDIKYAAMMRCDGYYLQAGAYMGEPDYDWTYTYFVIETNKKSSPLIQMELNERNEILLWKIL